MRHMDPVVAASILQARVALGMGTHILQQNKPDARATPYPALPCPTLPYPALPCHAMPCSIAHHLGAQAHGHP